MGGGSSDCAAFIILMNKLFNLKLTEGEMEEMGKKLGADVVPCFYDIPVIAEGIGDRITKIKSDFKYYVLIVKPDISFSTKEMYRKIDIEKIEQKDTTKEIVQALKEKDIKVLSEKLYNSFETVAEQKEKIRDIKEDLVRNGAISSLMTGSGSAVYGIFKNKKEAKKAYEKLKKIYTVYISISYNK